jgi:hypothetical protein
MPNTAGKVSSSPSEVGKIAPATAPLDSLSMAKGWRILIYWRLERW